MSCRERYIDIILKMEEMLKTWFPNVKPNHQTTAVELTQETALLKKPKVECFAIVAHVTWQNMHKCINMSD